MQEQRQAPIRSFVILFVDGGQHYSSIRLHPDLRLIQRLIVRADHANL